LIYSAVSYPDEVFILFPFFNLVDYQINIISLLYLNKLRNWLMFSLTLFEFLINNFPVFIFFNFVFEIQIFRLFLSRDKIFKWFCHIVIVNPFFWNRIKKVNHCFIFLIILILFRLIFIVFKNIFINLSLISFGHFF